MSDVKIPEDLLQVARDIVAMESRCIEWGATAERSVELAAETIGTFVSKRIAALEAENARLKLPTSGFVAALATANAVLEQYKIDQPKWWKRMDGTPILNDVAVRMAQAFLLPQGYSFADLGEAERSIEALEQERDALKAQVERLTAPVNAATEDYERLDNDCFDFGVQVAVKNFIAARASQKEAEQ